MKNPSFIPGAGRDLEQLVRTHLFIVCPNNSGSSFLAAALGKCQAAWRLPQEGQFIRAAVLERWRKERPKAEIREYP